MRFRRVLLLAILALLMAAVPLVPLLMDPLRRSTDSIRNSLLMETPVGSDIQDVRVFLEERGWRDRGHLEDRGVLKTEGGLVTIGSRSLRAELGAYQGIPFRTHVSAFYAFDDHGKLIDLWVAKTREAP